MNQRRAYLDQGVGESRGVVTLDGRPERLMVVRDGDDASQALGARWVVRVRSIARGQALAFLDLGDGPDAVLNLSRETGPITEGAWVEIEIRSEARAGKGAVARWLGPGTAPGRLLSPGPCLDARLKAVPGIQTIDKGDRARAMADAAQDEALCAVFALPGGGTLSVEPTRALTAIDVDVGARPGGDSKHTARAANLAAIAEAARILRLKGLGGLIVMDLAGRGHDAPTLLAAARVAFAPDNPGVAFGAISRFGALELTIPRKARPVVEVLCDFSGGESALTCAMALIRALEREARRDGGGRFEGLAAPEVAEAASPALARLVLQLGARVNVIGESGRPRAAFEVRRR